MCEKSSTNATKRVHIREDTSHITELYAVPKMLFMADARDVSTLLYYL